MLNAQPNEEQPYERLLGDALAGDGALFTREDAVEAAWAVVEPVLENHNRSTNATVPRHDPQQQKEGNHPILRSVGRLSGGIACRLPLAVVEFNARGRWECSAGCRR